MSGNSLNLLDKSFFPSSPLCLSFFSFFFFVSPTSSSPRFVSPRKEKNVKFFYFPRISIFSFFFKNCSFFLKKKSWNAFCKFSRLYSHTPHSSPRKKTYIPSYAWWEEEIWLGMREGGICLKHFLPSLTIPSRCNSSLPHVYVLHFQHVLREEQG